ncbi:YtxH domain-containing protein [Actinomadura decatromicini]|uniref:YtxH domain-containing protein n=1 Tax=Actinomadura decatromicini TaxID=2604572 RepID=A0A5D3FIX0_9ACTN|nr:YtxH domain-containing protein [Actinomadura decatromicini]TYK48109.1 YtxH domain-containing protein [Actinomadura decatromicini]
MKARTMFMAGAALGYVLGTKAGRERYEQIKRLSQQVSENPNVQEAAGKLRAKGEVFAGAARDKAGHLKDRVPEQLPGRKPADEQQPGVYPG